MAEKTTRRGEVTESFRHLQRAVALAPGLQEAHNNLGASLVKNGQLEAAGGSGAVAGVLKGTHGPLRSGEES